ncbi:amidase [Acinetobacter sp. c1-l78]|uniref:amidase n=1 Tax=Acinetobacter sp. c1-l78 TaxID=3342803 RepID=UPI0035BB73C0
MFKEYTQYDAMGLAELVKSKQVSAKELLDSAIAITNQHNPKLNAIIHRFDERAYNAIQQGLPDGVFTGVPYLLKDLLYEFADEPMSMGSRSVKFVPKQDNAIVQQIKATGVNIFGKTNTPEFGLIITTEPKAFGACQNPAKSGYSTGGSSGGSAAAVASGIVPMAGSGDGGGSIRFPASWCGVFGLKPSRGRTPISSVLGEDWNGAVINHVISRSVRDSAAMLDATSGIELGANYHSPRPEQSFLTASQTPSRPLKIAIHVRPLIANTVIDPEVMACLQQTAKHLESMGHHVDYAEPVFNQSQVWRDFLVMVCSHTAHQVHDLATRLGREHVSELEPQTLNMAMMGRSLSALDFLNAKQGWQDLRLATDRLLQDYDVILCPTVPTPAVKNGILPPKKADEIMMQATSGLKIGKMLLNSGMVEKLSQPVLPKMAFTILANMTGMPAMSVPLGMSAEGLPIGMQFIAGLNDEATLFSLAGDLEKAGLFQDVGMKW